MITEEEIIVADLEEISRTLKENGVGQPGPGGDNNVRNAACLATLDHVLKGLRTKLPFQSKGDWTVFNSKHVKFARCRTCETTADRNSELRCKCDD